MHPGPGSPALIPFPTGGGLPVDAAERAAREREAAIAKFLRGLRQDLVYAGYDPAWVDRLSPRELIDYRRRAFAHLQATAPGGH